MALRRLGTDYIDLLQLHAFDAMTPVEETLSTLDGLVRAGKLRYLGASNFSGWQLMKSLAVADRRGYSRYVAHQAYYSLIGRDYEWELMPLGLDQGIGAVVWSPLGWGRLTGRIRRGQPLPEGSRLHDTASFAPPVDEERLYRVVEALDALAKETGKSVPQLALNWLLRRPTVSTVLIGARNEEQLRQNLGAIGWSLTPEQLARLDAASAVTPPYPTIPIGTGSSPSAVRSPSDQAHDPPGGRGSPTPGAPSRHADARRPHDVGELELAFHEASVELIERQGGSVVLSMGGEVLACFGWTQGREDDSERAVRTALQLTRELRDTMGRGLPHLPLSGLFMRSGVHTELMAVGTRLQGEAPNVAAWLARQAGPGDVVVSDTTWKRVRGAFQSEPLGSHAFEGLSGSVSMEAHRVRGEREVASRFERTHVAGRLSPLVERERMPAPALSLR